jgi:hypothetical protein
MSLYYIILHSGLLKQYYSESKLGVENLDLDSFIFSSSLRNARSFKTFEEASYVVNTKNLKDCSIINQNGILQNQ